MERSIKRTRCSLKKKANFCKSNTVQALFKYRVTVMKYRLSPAAVLFSKTENNN